MQTFPRTLQSLLFLLSVVAVCESRTSIVNLSNPIINVGLACTVRSYPAPSSSLAPALYDPNKLVPVYNDYRNYSTSSWNEALSAAILALNEINLGWYPFANLRNYTLRLRYEDTKSDDKTATKAALNLGDVTIAQTPELNSVAAMFANVFEYRAQPSLIVRDRTEMLNDPVNYPNTVSTKLPVSTFGKSMANVFVNLGWQSAVVVATNEQLSVDFLTTFLPLATTKGITISSIITVLDAQNSGPSLDLLHKTQSRVVLLSSTITLGNPIMKQAAAMGLLGPGSPYTWVHYGNCLEIPSNPYANRTYIDGFLCLTTVAADTPAKNAMYDRIRVGLPKPPNSWMYNTFRWEKSADVYDGFLIIAQTLDTFIGLKSGCIRNGWASSPACVRMAADANEDLTMRKIMLNSTVRGLSSNISFDSGLVYTNVLLKQMAWQPDVARETSFTVMSIDPRTFQTTRVGTFRWSDGTSTIPPATQPPIVIIATFSKGAAFGAMALAALTIIFGVVCLCFNMAYFDVPTVKLSAPRMNMISALGCISFCVCVFLLTVDPPTVNACSALIWLVPISFTLLFTPMFSKSFRIYRIFSKKLEKKVITDWQLAHMVIAFLAIDIALILAFTMPDAVKVSQTLLLEKVDPDVTTRYLRLSCNSSNSQIIVYLMLAYKGLILFGASYMTFKTRQAHMEQVLADSRSIGMSVYSTSLLAGFLVPIQAAIYNSVDGQETGFILTAYGLCLLSLFNLVFLFVPKMLIIWVDKETRKAFAHTCLAQCFRAAGVPMTSNSTIGGIASNYVASSLGNQKPNEKALQNPQLFVGVSLAPHSNIANYTGKTAKFGPSEKPETPRSRNGSVSEAPNGARRFSGSQAAGTPAPAQTQTGAKLSTAASMPRGRVGAEGPVVLAVGGPRSEGSVSTSGAAPAGPDHEVDRELSGTTQTVTVPASPQFVVDVDDGQSISRMGTN